MATVGYSGKPVFEKLGIRNDMKLMLISPPSDYETILGTRVTGQMAKKAETPDLVHLFVKSNKEFETEMKKLKAVYRDNPKVVIWVSWYKKSAGIPTDVTEDTIRNYALKNDLVDIKVCAVSEVWSGLKLVVQKAKR